MISNLSSLEVILTWLPNFEFLPFCRPPFCTTSVDVAADLPPIFSPGFGEWRSKDSPPPAGDTFTLRCDHRFNLSCLFLHSSPTLPPPDVINFSCRSGNRPINPPVPSRDQHISSFPDVHDFHTDSVALFGLPFSTRHTLSRKHVLPPAAAPQSGTFPNSSRPLFFHSKSSTNATSPR